MENLYETFVRQPFESLPPSSNCYLTEKNLDELGNRSRKHLEQIGSIINQVAELNLLQGNTSFIEMGAGRGQLSHELHACLKNESNVEFVLIERDHQRYRFDAHHRREQQGPTFERYRLDIRDFYLSELPSIKLSNEQKQVIVISKHLCGGATDLTLRCAIDGAKNTNKVRAIIIALCCHHRLMWNDYVGR